MSSTGKVERRHHRHAGVLPAVLDDGLDQLAVLIVQHELRAQQVRPAHVAAAEVGAVAGTAGGGINLLAAGDHRRIARAAAAGPGRWPDRVLVPAGRAALACRGRRRAPCAGGCGRAAPCAAIWTARDANMRADAATRLVLGPINHLENRSAPAEEANHMRFQCGFNTTRRPPPLTAPPLHLTGK